MNTRVQTHDGVDVFTGLRVLFVEDSAEEREMYVAVLERRGARVTPAASVGEAIDAFGRIQPELIVTDIAPPGTGGCEFLRAIRKLAPHEGGRTPAVAVTSATEPDQCDDARNAGFNECVTKPAGADALASAITRLAAAIEETRAHRRGAPLKWPAAGSRDQRLVRTPTNVLVLAERRIGNKFVDALREEDRKALTLAAQRVRFDSWETLYPVGEPVSAIYIPEDCLVSVLSTTEAGKAVEVLSVGTNGVVGLSALLSDRPSPNWVQTTVGGVAWRVGLRDLRDLMENSPTLLRSLFRTVNSQTVEIAQSAACNRAHRLDGQIARWILTACDRTGSSQLRLSHEQIAERLAVRRASVSVAIESFVRDGLVKGSRGSLTVTDRDGLRAVACECFAAIEAEWESAAAAH